MTKIDSKIPEGPVAEKWTNYKAHQKLVNPANKRRLDIIVVGTGLVILCSVDTALCSDGVCTARRVLDAVFGLEQQSMD